MRWVDTHVHLDAPEFDADRRAVRQQARDAGVAHCVIPAVERSNFDTVRKLAQAEGDSYCLGIHPLYVAGAQDADLVALDEALTAHVADPRLVAIGEIGLDYFVPALCKSPLRERQEALYRQQLKLARKHGLPVVLHVRKSSDRLLKHLREVAGPNGRWQGIAHAFNGSEVQAAEFIKLGFKLGFGGAVTFDRALQLRHLAKTLPLDALVLETDAPDIQPHWLYTTAEQRAAGHPQGRNAPAELPRIAECIAKIRGISVDALAAAALHNSLQALPKLGALLV
ncbi:putative deoxyribonuclease YjjV [Curvibacter sp. AEP1-3]|uniref:TatD family hydrolase n=1 Tax=Curvibacter sp. AEP1-3 TaxID=1844971 RepID=UPI000B3CD528|nr:TatD family hydrolase [Curvibacter sp. AEP1-3]ARV18243.1 putative deoxyribonuclease YjjV [Curvibacter sp. AEP1-3]